MKANTATIRAPHVASSTLHAPPRGVGAWSEAKNPTGFLILRWILGWGLLLFLAVVALAAVSTSVGPTVAAVPEVRRPSDSGIASDPSVLLNAGGHVYYVP